MLFVWSITMSEAILERSWRSWKAASSRDAMLLCAASASALMLSLTGGADAEDTQTSSAREEPHSISCD